MEDRAMTMPLARVFALSALILFVAAAIAMWLGIKREDLVKAPAKTAAGDPDDPNGGAVV